MDRREKMSTGAAQISQLNHIPVLIIGAGPAGLLLSGALGKLGIEHLILEKGSVAESWRSQRWDSLRITGPNWLFQLPDFPNSSANRDGFMNSGEVVDYFERFASRIQAPVLCGKYVTSVAAIPDGNGFYVDMADGARYTGGQVVVANGIFHTPIIPDLDADLPDGICQLTPSAYRRPSLLPPGAVLVVGAGESGSQIAEELRHAGRTVYLSVGRTRWIPRRYRDKDFCCWWEQMGKFDDAVRHFRQGVSRHKDLGLQATGSDSGHDVNLHTLARDGVILLGRLQGIQDCRLRLESDLSERIAEADSQALEFKAEIDEFIETNQIDAADDDWPKYLDAYNAISTEPVVEIEMQEAGISTILWATGHRPNFSFVDLPVFDEAGDLIHDRWATPHPGFYFFGFQLLILGFAAEAEYLASVIASKLEATVRS